MINIRQIILSAKTGIVSPTSVIPDFIGQLYIDTVAQNIFYARSTSIGDYELIANFTDLIASNIETNSSGLTVQDFLDNLSGESHTQNTDTKLDEGGVNEITALVIKAFVDSKAQVNGLASLDATGKVPTSQIPAIAITDVYVVADITARDALTVQTGDVAKVVDSDGFGSTQTYIWDGSAWIDIQETSDVISVNGQTGVVNVDSTQIDTTESGKTVQNKLDELDDDSHIQNTDIKLDDGQPNEVTSSELRNHIDDTTSNPHNVEANDINTEQSGLTVQDQLDNLSIDKMDIDGNNSDIDKLLFKNNLNNPSYQEGHVFYDKSEHALSIYNDQSTVTHQLGQETLFRVFNDSGSLIQDGKAVYITGSDITEFRPTILKGISNDINKSNIIGLTTHDIPDQTHGYVTAKGLVNNLDTSSFSVGDILYLSNTVEGDFVNSPPSTPNIIVQIGHVLRQDTTSGRILVDLRHLGAVPLILAKTIFFRPERVNSIGDYKVKKMGQGGVDNFLFNVPSDFTSLIDLQLIFSPDSTIAVDKTVNLDSDYGTIGENITNHSESVINQSITGTGGIFTTLDISTVFTALGADDICGLKLNLNNIGSGINVYGIRLRYQ
jgi:hypothetical protein